MGNCWFIGALSILASDDTLIYHNISIDDIKNKNLSDKQVDELTKGVYPKIFHFLDKFGIYIFRFFKDQKWLYVLIDDKLPCFAGSV